MKKEFQYFLSLILLCLSVMAGMAQTDTARNLPGLAPAAPGLAVPGVAQRQQVAIFAPLYLDSAFDAAGNYRYDKNFPKFLNPGLEFYEGVQLALDSLRKENVQLDVQLYDTRSTTQSIAQALQSPGFQHTGLIIGHVVNGELQQLAAEAAFRHIPFINVNFPNDGGISNNPELVILNSTLKSHCEAVYKFVQRNFSTRPVFVFRRKGGQEDRLQHYFTDIEKSTASVPLKIRYITLDDDFGIERLLPLLDSTRKTICIAGSLDPNFGQRLCQLLTSVNKTYTTVIIGMPNWDNPGDFAKPEYSGTPIIYSTPFYINQADNLVKSITQDFRTHFFSRPSDMVFRGYETTYRFSKLLLQYGGNINGSLGEKKFRVFNDFDIQPVFLNRQNMTLDYFENKKLYFLTAADHEIYDPSAPPVKTGPAANSGNTGTGPGSTPPAR